MENKQNQYYQVVGGQRRLIWALAFGAAVLVTNAFVVVVATGG